MQPDVWVHGAVLALAIAQFLIFWYLYRRSGVSSTHEAGQRTAPAGGDSTDRPDEHHVACPNCGAPNTARFRYCQDCVEELSRGAGSS